MTTVADADRAARRAQVVEALADAVATFDRPPPVHVAVDGMGGAARALADDLGRALAARGRRCRRVSLGVPGFLDPRAPGPWPAGTRGGPGDDLVLVDGRFLQHPEYAGAWELVVFLREDAGQDRAYARYLERLDPEVTADVVVDLHDPDWPVIRRVDPVVAGRLRPGVLLAETRAFFAPRAAAWEERFPDDDPAYGAAAAELGLRPGQTALDAGCGTGRALPHLRAAVGPGGRVVAVDLTQEMLAAARARGRHRHALLAVADARRLPLAAASLDGAFAAGLLPHLPDPGSGLADLAGWSAPAAGWSCSTPAAWPPWPPATAAASATTTCWPPDRSTSCCGGPAGRLTATRTGQTGSSPWPSGLRPEPDRPDRSTSGGPRPVPAERSHRFEQAGFLQGSYVAGPSEKKLQFRGPRLRRVEAGRRPLPCAAGAGGGRGPGRPHDRRLPGPGPRYGPGRRRVRRQRRGRRRGGRVGPRLARPPRLDARVPARHARPRPVTG